MVRFIHEGDREKGQVTIQKDLRDELGIGAGTEVLFERQADTIVVRKAEQPTRGRLDSRASSRPRGYSDDDRRDHGAHPRRIGGYRNSRRRRTSCSMSSPRTHDGCHGHCQLSKRPLRLETPADQPGGVQRSLDPVLPHRGHGRRTAGGGLPSGSDALGGFISRWQGVRPVSPQWRHPPIRIAGLLRWSPRGGGSVVPATWTLQDGTYFPTCPCSPRQARLATFLPLSGHQ